MTESNWQILTEIQSRGEAEVVKGYLALHGIDSYLVQEAIGQLIPTNLDMFGRVEVFVSREDLDSARKFMVKYFEALENDDPR